VLAAGASLRLRVVVGGGGSGGKDAAGGGARGNHEGGFTEEEDAGRFREWMKEGDDVGPTHDLL
jgi:hypothetical protein